MERGPVTPQEAFVFNYTYDGMSKYVFSWQMPQYYYMYKDKFALDFTKPIAINTSYSNNDTAYEDPYFGHMRIYREKAEISLQIEESLNQPVDVIISYQGCWDGGVCYAPQKATITLSGSLADINKSVSPLNSFDDTAYTFSSPAPATGSFLAEIEGANTSKQKAIERDVDFTDLITNNDNYDFFLAAISQSSIPWMMLIFFISGIALAFTPCVFPTIPLVSGIITNSRNSMTPLRAFMMTLTFVFSSSLAYSFIGVVVSVLGHNLQILLQQPWIIIASAGIFVVLAAAMFGMFSIQTPLVFRKKLNNILNKQNYSGFYGVAVMGLLSTLIIGPCLTAPLAGILVYLSDRGNPVHGGLSLFVLGMGMGTPLLLAGTVFGSWLPRAGTWLKHIQHVFGFIMLLMAVWMLDKVFPELSLLLYGLVFISFSLYLFYIKRPGSSSGNGWLMNGVSSIVLLFGLLQILGYTTGGTDVYQPLKGSSLFAASATDSNRDFLSKEMVITSNDQLNYQIQLAQKTGKSSMVKFNADWCVACEQIERDVFSDATVISEIEDIHLIVADVTTVNDYALDLLETYKIPGPPALLFFDDRGNYRKDLVLIGNITRQKVLDTLTRIKS